MLRLFSPEDKVLFLGAVWTKGPEAKCREEGFWASETGLDERGKTLEMILS